MVIVPLYDTLGANACAFIVNQSMYNKSFGKFLFRCPLALNYNPLVVMISAEMSIVVCEDDKKANLLLDQSPRCLRKLITIKEVSPSTHQRAKSRGVDIMKFTDVEIQGAHKDHPCVVSKSLFNVI